ncbi:MAG: SpoIIE family protein phosphatase [Chitinispirillales bacterium]|jgi:DNA-binding LacI/PurR family transcriptional regulator/serine phosphatase RsbU (regulator of sigma subunit)|nr:SpoIIE family protein phosphatase [Chitinispirillales bacterium]
MKNICLLLEGVAGLYYSTLWPGVVDCAKENGCNVVCFAGGALRLSPQNPYEVQRNVIYNHIDASMFDGIIISGTLNNFISEIEFAKFMERFSGLPTVSLAPALENIPSVVVDNASGMKSLISHLAQAHDCSKFAFIGGPKGNLDADQRLDLFRRYLKEHGLECAEERIVAGDFSRSGGYKAALELLKRGVEFDALVAANDETALGAIEILLDSDTRVPEDVSVTGFDDIEESELTTPPLTTVRQPLYEIGRTAVELLLAKIEGKDVPRRTVLQAPLAIRQSCGCFINPKHTLDRRTFSIIQRLSDNTERLKEQLMEDIYSFVAMEMGTAIEDEDIKELAHSFFDEVDGSRVGVFLPALNRIVRAATLAASEGDDLLQWQKILVTIRKYTQGMNGAKAEAADNLLHDSYNLFSETAARQQAHKRLQAEQKAALMRSVGHSIANSFDIPALMQAVIRMFPRLEINDFYLSLYDKSTKGFLNSKPVFALQHGKKENLPPDVFFPTKDLIPGGVKESEKPFHIIVQPLHFRSEQLGMAVFKDGPLTGYIYDILGEHLSGALQGALLMKKIQEQAATLEEANKELEKLRQQEHMRLEAIQRELQIGRTIQESFLPESMPQMPGWESRALFMPAREVSGDFYDAFALEDGRVAFVIADVSGKDVGAALFMSLIRSLIRAFAESSLEGAANPLNAVELTNRYIVHHHHTSKGRFMYATMFFAIVDPKSGEVTYINAGHNPPALLHPEGKITRWLPPTGPAVGVGIKEDLKYKQETLTLKPGEMILMYTDGVIEAKNDKGEFLEQKRFASLIEKPYSSSDDVIDRVKEALKEHCAGADPYDDVTMVGIFRQRG